MLYPLSYGGLGQRGPGRDLRAGLRHGGRGMPRGVAVMSVHLDRSLPETRGRCGAFDTTDRVPAAARPTPLVRGRTYDSDGRC
jgi:hypothetical protein